MICYLDYFWKFMYSISVSKYGVTVNILDFLSSLLWKYWPSDYNKVALIGSKFECLPWDCSLTLLRFFNENPDDISCICKKLLNTDGTWPVIYGSSTRERRSGARPVAPASARSPTFTTISTGVKDAQGRFYKNKGKSSIGAVNLCHLLVRELKNRKK